MQKELKLVQEFHEKFKIPVLEKPSLIPIDRSDLRSRLIVEEANEYKEDGIESGQIENIAKELCDILYSTYGTILEHGLQDKIEKVFEEVHKSQMSKDYSQYKMIKGKKYFEADLKKIFKK